MQSGNSLLFVPMYTPRHSDALERMPDELTAALDAAPDAKAVFDQLAPSHKREYVQWINSARRDDTRERRAAQTVMRLLAPTSDEQ